MRQEVVNSPVVDDETGNRAHYVSSGKPLTILLVEDDDGDFKAVKRAFLDSRIANLIVRATDGIDALDTLRGTHGKQAIQSPCILLVDLNMPRMNGIQFIKELRRDKALSQSIVFVLTTSKSDEDMMAAYDLNVAGYIVKENAGRDFLSLVGLMDSFWRVVEIP
jgi:CheY-like chemotaxis protein